MINAKRPLTKVSIRHPSTCLDLNWKGSNRSQRSRQARELASEDPRAVSPGVERVQITVTNKDGSVTQESIDATDLMVKEEKSSLL